MPRNSQQPLNPANWDLLYPMDIATRLHIVEDELTQDQIDVLYGHLYTYRDQDISTVNYAQLCNLPDQSHSKLIVKGSQDNKKLVDQVNRVLKPGGTVVYDKKAVTGAVVRQRNNNNTKKEKDNV